MYDNQFSLILAIMQVKMENPQKAKDCLLHRPWVSRWELPHTNNFYVTKPVFYTPSSDFTCNVQEHKHHIPQCNHHKKSPFLFIFMKRFTKRAVFVSVSHFFFLSLRISKHKYENIMFCRTKTPWKNTHISCEYIRKRRARMILYLFPEQAIEPHYTYAPRTREGKFKCHLLTAMHGKV